MVEHSQTNIKSDLEFRIEFKKEYGIDYFEAVDNLNKRKEESDRKWRNILTRYGIN